MARTLFHGGLVFDGTGAPPAPGDVVIEDGRLADVGAPGLDGDEEVECHGLVVLPGLFDCHTHVTFSGDLDLQHMVSRPWSMRYFEAVVNLERTLATGITTVREAAGADLGVKHAVERGLIPGPRLQISIAMLSQTGGHGDTQLPTGGCLGWPHPYPGNPGGIVDGPDAVRKRVRELVREGADVIKVATSGGVLSPRDDPRHGHFRDDELRVLVDEARAAGKFVMAHAQATDGIKAAIRHGVRSIEHGIFLDDEAIDMMLAADAWLVPTLLAPRAVISSAQEGMRILEESLRKANEVLDSHSESVRRAVAAGVKIAMGTDSGVGPHGRNLEELGLMVEHGMAPLDAWRATTGGAAALMGLDEQFGTLEPGKRADVVLLRGDLVDLAKLSERIAGVWKDGQRAF
jgi:imidazolonepropionase-like amidohydrolase